MQYPSFEYALLNIKGWIYEKQKSRKFIFELYITKLIKGISQNKIKKKRKQTWAELCQAQVSLS